MAFNDRFEKGDNVLTCIKRDPYEYFETKENRMQSFGVVADIVHPDTWRMPMVRYIVVDHGQGIVANYHAEEVDLL